MLQKIVVAIVDAPFDFAVVAANVVVVNDAVAPLDALPLPLMMPLLLLLL